MSYLSVSKFSQHQHYKNRKPPWIKFYVALLDPHHPINELPLSTRYLFDRLLLLAAEYDNAIPNDPELIAKLLRMPPRACREGLEQLRKGRWIKATRTKRRASKPASDFAPPETEKDFSSSELSTSKKDVRANGSSETATGGWVENLSAYTGCRLVRGTHAFSAVRDPLGVDKPPFDWPWPKPTRKEVVAALERQP